MSPLYDYYNKSDYLIQLWTTKSKLAGKKSQENYYSSTEMSEIMMPLQC